VVPLLVLGGCSSSGTDAQAPPEPAVPRSAAQAPPGPTSSRAAPAPVKKLTPKLKAEILAAMRLNRQAFQENAVLKRYGDERPPADHPALVKCELPRTSTGAPASQYPAKKAQTTERAYRESDLVDCLATKGGLTGTRAEPLAQHYYCGLPGFSPDIRGCFTFQLRLKSVSPTRSAVDDNGYMPDGRTRKLEKGWDFIGDDPDTLPDVAKAFAYCATDGRPHWIKNTRGTKLDVETIHPTPTRPMCWVAETQADLFSGLMSGLIGPPISEQIALLKEYYECSRIKGKVSATRYRALCEIDVSEWSGK